MRRLAKQTREDSYSSRRDYQRFEEARGLRLTAMSDASHELAFELALGEDVPSLIAFGGYLAPSQSVDMHAAIRAVGLQSAHVYREVVIHCSASWIRFGVAVPGRPPAVASLRWEGGCTLDFWGVTGGKVTLPDPLIERQVAEDELLKTHLVPETFYFEHGAALDLDLVPETSSRFSLSEGRAISLKRCSYCGRWLPVDPARPGALAFHKHNAKVTKHQNECRACKKWRINDSFNPIRTKDQLHESSVITRERRVFLRDPEILQTIKDRSGAGLKSQVWERFAHRCFYCKRELLLDEVQLDHTRPLAYLWPIDEYATCLCAEHNNHKKDRFPVDFYNDSQLEELATITGLPLPDLRERDVNETELQRILVDLPTFAREWDPRHFAATARKIAELRPEIDLFSLLARADQTTFDWLHDRLQERPLAVDFEMSNEA